MKTTRLCLTALTLALAASACGGIDTNDSPVSALEKAQARASAAGHYLRPIADAVDARVAAAVQSGMELDRAREAAFRKVFGDPLEYIPSWGGCYFSDVFLYNPELGLEGVDTMTTVGGYPVVVVWSLSSGMGLFYEPTVIDTATGALYQGLVTEEGLKLFGPRLPPISARVIGAFTPEEISTLEEAFFAGAWAGTPTDGSDDATDE